MNAFNEEHRRMNEQMITELEEQIRVHEEGQRRHGQKRPGDDERFAEFKRRLDELKERREFFKKNP